MDGKTVSIELEVDVRELRERDDLWSRSKRRRPAMRQAMDLEGASWFRGREAIAAFLAGWPLSGSWQWRVVHARANGQPALAYYAWDADEGSHLPFALNVLTLRGRRISDVTAFVTRSTPAPEREVYARWVEQPIDPSRMVSAFGRFGLPERVD